MYLVHPLPPRAGLAIGYEYIVLKKKIIKRNMYTTYVCNAIYKHIYGYGNMSEEKKNKETKEWSQTKPGESAVYVTTAAAGSH